MIDIEKLAIECGAELMLADETLFTTFGVDVYILSAIELEAFAKAYINEWLKEQEVVGYERNGIYREDVPINDIFLYTRLIALPSEAN